MKTILSELRMIAAGKLLWWAFLIAPKNADGNKMRLFLMSYFTSTVENKKFEEVKNGKA